MNCINCNAPLPEDAKFCGECGCPVQQNDPSAGKENGPFSAALMPGPGYSPEAYGRKKKKPGLTVIALLIIAALLIAFVAVTVAAVRSRRHPLPAGIGDLREHYTVLEGDGSDRATVMFYFIGSDLESEYGSASADITEILNAKGSENVNLVLQTGGCGAWETDELKDGRVQRFCVEDGALSEKDDLGKVSMLDAGTLKSFIKWCANEYPAERYVLILWDHGGGDLDGFGYDDNFPEDTLMISELTEALGNGGVKFDFIGFDACYMATLEAAFALEPYADYLIASAESEPEIGWDYTGWINALCRDPAEDTLELAEILIDDFAGLGNSYYELLTLSVTELREIPYVVKTLTDFLYGIGQDDYDDVAGIRADTLEFGDRFYEQIDLLDFAQRCGDLSGGTKELCDAVLSAVKYQRSNYTTPCGLSFYFPHYYPYAYYDARDEFKRAGFPDEYFMFMDDYVKRETGRGSEGLIDKAEWYDPENEPDLFTDEENAEDRELIEKDGYFAVPLSPEEQDAAVLIESRLYLYDEEGFALLGSDILYDQDDDGDLIADWDYYWLSLGGMTVPFYNLVNSEYDGEWHSYGMVPAVLNGEQYIEIIVHWDDNYEDGYVAGYRLYDDPDKTLRGFGRYDVIVFVCDYYDNDGNFEDVYDWGEVISACGGRLSVDYLPVYDCEGATEYKIVLEDGTVIISEPLQFDALEY